MNLSKEYWSVCETMDTHVLYDRNLAERYVDVSVKGYAKRNQKMPTQIQLVLKDIFDQIVCMYMPEDEAEMLIIPLKPTDAPNPDTYWHAWWNSYGKS